jgi:hypothetical protein
MNVLDGNLESIERSCLWKECFRWVSRSRDEERAENTNTNSRGDAHISLSERGGKNKTKNVPPGFGSPSWNERPSFPRRSRPKRQRTPTRARWSASRPRWAFPSASCRLVNRLPLLKSERERESFRERRRRLIFEMSKARAKKKKN